MKKILCGLLLFGSLAMRAQVSNPSIISVGTAPSGSCFAGLPNQQVTSTGTQYSCQNVVSGVGTWGAIGGSSSSFTALTGDATSTSTGGATTVKGINGTSLSGLATGLLTNTTGTGVPTITSPSTTVNGTTCTLGSTCTVTGSPTGSAGGDLGGTYPNPGVVQVNGAVVPASAGVAGTNSSRQIVVSTAAQIAAFNKNVIVASAGNSTLGVAACTLNTNINTGGGTAADSCLQADLDALGVAGGGTLYLNGYALLTCSNYNTTNAVDGNVQTTALQTHSNVKIDATGGGVFLQANSNCTMLGNNISGNVTASTWQTNMEVDGGVWNGNGNNIANQSRYEAGVSTSWWNMGFWFGGFNTLRLVNNTVRNATTFEITLSNGTNFTILNPITTQDAMCTLANCNNDGIHLWGTLTYGYVSNWLSVNNDDDPLAMNTDEGVYLPTTSAYANPSRFPASGGSLNDITVDTATWSPTKHSVRWYGVITTGGVATLSNILLNNITAAPTVSAMNTSGITASTGLAISTWNVTGSQNSVVIPTTTGYCLQNINSTASVTLNTSTGGCQNYSGIQFLGNSGTTNVVLSSLLAPNLASGTYVLQQVGTVSTGNNSALTGWVHTGTNTGFYIVVTNGAAMPVVFQDSFTATTAALAVANSSGTTSSGFTCNTGIDLCVNPSSNTVAPFTVAATGATTALSETSVFASAETVVFSATPTFSTAVRMSTITLTGSITSFTLAAGLDGQEKTLCFVQGSGSYTVTPPSNVHGFFTIGATNALRNCQHFNYNVASAFWLSDSTGVINE